MSTFNIMNRNYYLEQIQSLEHFCFTTKEIDLGDLKIQDINEEFQVYSVKGSTGVGILTRTKGKFDHVLWDNMTFEQLVNLYSLIATSVLL
jgi:hypothetical protein